MKAIRGGSDMHSLARRLFPICRSLTGNGVRETLKILQEYIPLKIFEVKSGTKVFDWTVPLEWNIRDAYIADETGRRVVDFKKHNLHVVGYSTPIDTTMTLKELQVHLHSLPDQPSAIPYVTSYYKEGWGFCLTHKQRMSLKDGKYRVVIDSTLKKGRLTYGELIIPGKSKEEIFLSTYVCHPSMANNELSGPVVTAGIAQFLASRDRRYTYRIIFIPETIGSITYLSRNVKKMRAHTIAGFVLTCCGDEKTYSFLPSRYGMTYADRVARRVLKKEHIRYKEYDFSTRGSDERQYSSALVDLPVVSIMRSKYATYPQYHTSLDDLTFVTPKGLQGGFDVYKKCIEYIEKNRRYIATVYGEPQMGKRGMHKHILVGPTLQVFTYADGTNDAFDLMERFGYSAREIRSAVNLLLRQGLIKEL